MKKKETKKENKVMNILNNPKIILTALSVICVLLLIYSYSLKKSLNENGQILVGSIETDEIYVPNIHFMTNKKMNYFYASPASSEYEEKIYSYQIGYYVKNDKGNLIEFTVRKGNMDDSVQLANVLADLSSWNFGELDDQNVFFTKENKKYLNNLYLIINASTEKDSPNYDIKKEFKVNVISLTE